MNNPSFGPFAFAQGPEPVEGVGAKHPAEACNKDFSLFAGAYSRMQRIRELCRLAVLKSHP
jgi:hypothetical protein